MEIARVLERMEDGRLNLLSKGPRPFRIVERVDHLPYPAATVEFLQDADELPDAAAAETAHAAYRALVEQATDAEPDDEDVEVLDAYGMAATVEFLQDADEVVEPAVAELAHAAYRHLVEQATDAEPDDEDVAVLSAYAMAATVEFGLEAKQGLLDLRSENARLRLVTRLFRAATKRLEFIEKAQVRARSNGKVRFG
jgi:Lon protease-like protein